MSDRPRILAFAGSLRRDSFNRQALEVAVEGVREAGADVTVLELRELPLPVFDADLEAEGTPANATTLKQALIDSDGVLIASPEYNSSITAALKNAIDWASRSQPGEAPLAAFRGKTAAILSASPGGIGGMRGLVHLRSILGNLGMFLHPDQVSVSSAHEVFQDGVIQNERTATKLRALGAALVDLTRRQRH